MNTLKGCTRGEAYNSRHVMVFSFLEKKKKARTEKQAQGLREYLEGVHTGRVYALSRTTPLLAIHARVGKSADSLFQGTSFTPKVIMLLDSFSRLFY